jgi:hypothetical protein
VQELALVAVLADDAKLASERDWRQFVLSMVASTTATEPRRAHKYLKLLDKEEVDLLADDEIPEDYVPIQQREGLAQALRDLQTLGGAVMQAED